MCGINGFTFRDEEKIHEMNEITKYRGPDATAVWVQEGISLGHNRLSIIDTSTNANQPMESADGRYVIVYNGEVYNFQELRTDLSDYSFRTGSDTEVILAAYARWGKNCVKRFNGMFAFAIWDKQEQSLFLARDQIGIKPLYYCVDGDRFIFSSALKGVLVHDIDRVLDMDAFAALMRVQYAPAPLTMIRGVKQLPPAHTLLFRGGKVTIESYWSSSVGETDRYSREEWKTQIRETIDTAVTRQLISDRPLGIYLSGGFDSSIVLDAVASKTSGNINTFSTGFALSDDEQAQKYNYDFQLAKRTAEHYGTNHHEVLLHEQDVVDQFEQVVWHMDEPRPNPTSISMYTLAHFTKQHVDVILGGDGGDELFGGYDRYRLSLAASYYQRVVPRPIRSLLSRHERFKKLGIEAPIDRFALFFFQQEQLLDRVLVPDVQQGNRTKALFSQQYFSGMTGTVEEQLMAVDRQSWLVDHSLFLSDRMAMAAGLENRVPLLDLDVVALAGKIPIGEKIGLKKTKYIYKEAFRGRLPGYLYNQPKRGWFSPGAKWLRRDRMQSFVREVLSASYYAETAPLFDWDEIAKMYEDHVSKKDYQLTLLWTLITFQVWARLYNVKLG